MGFLDRLSAGRRKRVEPYGLWADDARQLSVFSERGGVLEDARDSEFSITFTDEKRARSAAKELRVMQVRGELVEPSHGVDEWSVVIHGRSQPLVPDFLRDTVDLAERLAAEHSGTYEGWVAKYTVEEKSAWGIEFLFDD
ncbi:ribonuclease E inhibitor RraB [Demequina sp.]|uniref:ribonuclease E inhibitor RraB n=1 Tax=Demequina sp. TaxID=2050685 RepID=UPI003A893521